MDRVRSVDPPSTQVASIGKPSRCMYTDASVSSMVVAALRDTVTTEISGLFDTAFTWLRSASMEIQIQPQQVHRAAPEDSVERVTPATRTPVTYCRSRILLLQADAHAISPNVRPGVEGRPRAAAVVRLFV